MRPSRPGSRTRRTLASSGTGGTDNRDDTAGTDDDDRTGHEDNGGEGARDEGFWTLTTRRLLHDRAAVASSGIVLFFILLALFAPVVAQLTGHGVYHQYSSGLTSDGLPRAPDSTFPLGTDDLGRDLLVRIAYGARPALLIGFSAAFIAVILGGIAGICAGFYGGVIDAVISRIFEILLAIPLLFIAICLASVLSYGPIHIGPIQVHQGVGLIAVLVGLFALAPVGRVIRGHVRTIRERTYVEASLSLGTSSAHTIWVDVLPNVTPQLLVYTTLLIPINILAAASLSYLGVGITPPQADWGSMIATAQNYYREAWWFLLFPVMALVTLTISFSVLGDSVRDAISPRRTR
ncbi:MAG TPA: ABC transporter permease [Acidimicrobiales bacterium]|nr:ABC transporter permease [Acidimicrobiales bacterium]